MNTGAEKLLTALEQERRYIAKELHDGVAQTTLQLGLQAGICSKLLERGNYKMLATELTQLEARVQMASKQVREMIGDMRPPAIEEDAGLIDHIKAAVDVHTERGGPQVTLNGVEAANALDISKIEMVALTRVVQEALLNIRKHARATDVRLTLTAKNNAVCLTVTDNGQGSAKFEAGSSPAVKVDAGLENMRARLEAVGGSLQIVRNPEGNGTQVAACLTK